MRANVRSACGTGWGEHGQRVLAAPAAGADALTMEERPRKPWHRDGMPAWAWGFLVASRVVAVLAALVPIAIAVGAWWWWNHPPGHGRRVMAEVIPHAQRAVDSLGVVVDSALVRVRKEQQ